MFFHAFSPGHDPTGRIAGQGVWEEERFSYILERGTDHDHFHDDWSEDMKDRRSLAGRFITLVIFCLALAFPYRFFHVRALAAEECEIVKAVFYEREQREIVTDLDSGVPYRRYRTVTYPCAALTIRDNSRLMHSKDIEVAATFADGNTEVKRGWCDKVPSNEGEIYSCVVCFESGSLISKVTCTFD